MRTSMKTSFCAKLISICLLSSQFAFAQEQETSNESTLTPKFGIKGGINLSNLYVDDASDENMRLGINAGLFAKIPLVRGLSFQPELLYSGKGAKASYDNFLQGKGEYRFNLHYVDLPASLVINLTRNLNIHGGVYAAYLVSATTTKVNSQGTIANFNDLNEDNYNRIDVGMLGGLALDIQNFTMGIRYNYGLRKIANSTGSDLALGNAKNSALSLYIGFGF